MALGALTGTGLAGHRANGRCGRQPVWAPARAKAGAGAPGAAARCAGLGSREVAAEVAGTAVR